MIDKIKAFIEANNIPQPPLTAIVGLSGGADSVVLTHVLLRLGYDVVPVHCNFHLRDAESDRDEQFVRAFCKRAGIGLDVKDFDTEASAKSRGVSIEMAARELRYAYFEDVRKKYNGEIFVAHHRDDSVETMLLNLIRGTGIAGICGIKPVNGHIMRPLLCVSREDIEWYAADNGLEFVTDSTNLQNDYTRNKIRNRLIPLLKEINPRVVDNLQTDMENFANAFGVYQTYVNERLQSLCKCDNAGNQSMAAVELDNEPHKTTLLHEWLKKHGFNPSQTKQIASCKNAENGTAFQSRSHVLRKESGFWTLYEKEPGSEPGSISINDILKIEETNDTTIIKSKDTAVFDASKLQFPLSVRKWQEGDRFQPIGMGGKTKKVSDLLCDLKMPLREKDKVLVLLSRGQIAWVIGIRPDERFKVTPSTKRVIKATIKPPRNG